MEFNLTFVCGSLRRFILRTSWQILRSRLSARCEQAFEVKIILFQ
jgi:hypothetical protein